MSTQPALLEEVEALISSTEIGRRAEALRRVTDLFASGSTVFSDDQREVFDDVMSRLVSEIDTSARAAFGRRIAAIPGAPSHVLRALALDDEISVAEPVSPARSNSMTRFCSKARGRRARSICSPFHAAPPWWKRSPTCWSSAETNRSP